MNEPVQLIRYDQVPFHGSVIPAALIDRNGRQTIVVHPKSTCDRLGVDWPSQYRNIKAHPVWSKGIVTMTTPHSSGNETLMLELRFWLLWLANIDPRRVNSDSSQLLMAYQEEAADVLQAHFLKAVQARAEFRIPKTFAEALRLAAEQQEQIEAQAAAIQVMAPKAEFHDQVTAAVNCLEVGEFAKLMLGTGPIRFFKWLREQKILRADNLPRQEHIDAGRLRVEERTRVDKRDQSHTYLVTVITGKGQSYLQHRWAQAGNVTQLRLEANG